MFGRARALDKLAEIEKSNRILNQAIESYSRIILEDSEVKDEVYLKAADRCVDRIRFTGKYMKAVPIHEAVIKKFPDEPKHQNDLAITYLMANRAPEAKRVLHALLLRHRLDGLALVHYGFILKTHDHNLQRGAAYLEQGIRSGAPGVLDGRFFFHLGDALQRLGQQDRAVEIYKLGVTHNLFPSVYQRSLYNVNHLHASPWWSIEETTYQKFFESLESNWEAIRDEGVRVLEMQRQKREGLYRDEAENLKDTGDWKQFELFARGTKNVPNCRLAPVTCGLVSAFPGASGCSRGQVKFSVMEPGTHVWPHCGPTNCRLRAHLGLRVPHGVTIRVAQETRTWKEGKIIIFDDSFEHEVWHNGTETRLVLIVDVWHPDLTDYERKTLPPI